MALLSGNIPEAASAPLGLNVRLLLPTEYVFQSHPKKPCNSEGTFKRRRITILFNCDDGLTRDAYGFTQFHLRHAAMLVPQLAHAVGNRHPSSHNLDRGPIQQYLESVLQYLSYHKAGKNSVEEQVAVMREHIETQ